jgi:hypothetical protein
LQGWGSEGTTDTRGLLRLGWATSRHYRLSVIPGCSHHLFAHFALFPSTTLVNLPVVVVVVVIRETRMQFI